MTDTPSHIARASVAVAKASQLRAALKDGKETFAKLLADLYTTRQQLLSLEADACRHLEEMKSLADDVRATLNNLEPDQQSIARALNRKRQAGSPTAGQSPQTTQVPAVARVTESLSLEQLMWTLDLLGIRSGVQTSGDGLLAWVSDRDYLHREDSLFRRLANGADLDDDVATRWIHGAALQLLQAKAGGSKPANKISRTGPVQGLT
jgi:hypothetical protein